MPLLVADLSLRYDHEEPIAAVARRLELPQDALLEVEVVRRAIDARGRKPKTILNCCVVLRDGEAAEGALLARRIAGVRLFVDRDEQRAGRTDFPLPQGIAWPRGLRPIVVGAGPGGLFAALRLAEAGAPPLLLERGERVEERGRKVQAFWRNAELDPESNVLFGEGGAGTFSDGKIYTRKRAGEIGYIFDRLIRFGAPSEIQREAWPHLGTDVLKRILPRFREHLEHLGVEIRFGARVDALIVQDERCAGVLLSDGERVMGGPVILATGHSARDLLRGLVQAGIAVEQRPFAIGLRVEHARSFIDTARHGRRSGELPPASYRLAWTPQGGRAVRTFCMCPGGIVVGATNHPEQLVLNGMSFSGRSSPWSNAALIVDVGPEDWGGEDPLAGMRLQESIERKAWIATAGSFRAPSQRIEDFLARRTSVDLPRSSYPLGIESVNLWDLLPCGVLEAIRSGIRKFDAEIPGFGSQGILLAPESRTTSPLRLPRGPDRASVSLAELYPVGEGAGHAGGIVSAALDGFRTAEALIARFVG